ncbi:MAG: bifunctional riboflavin kinase/FMN adenylyltransferase, partial [Blastocatellia bacterium]
VWRPSITNIGVRPTFENTADSSIETYIFDFDRDIYGDVIRVRFLYWIRDERKFGGPDELKDQIARDVQRARNFFSRRAVRKLVEEL